MRNISISQFIVIFLLGILLFSDFSKIAKILNIPVKQNKICKNLKKKSP